MTGFTTLRGLVRKSPAVGHCDLCGTALGPGHDHLIELGSRKLRCACDACAALFVAGGTNFKRIPRRVQLLSDFRITNAQWDSFLIPIGLAFFAESSLENRVVAFYPSPAGATESLLPLETWEEIFHENPPLTRMRPDVEALLVNRLDERAEYYLAPIDKCYQLVGLIRSNWRGLAGGSEVWQKIRDFFEALKENAYA